MYYIYMLKGPGGCVYTILEKYVVKHIYNNLILWLLSIDGPNFQSENLFFGGYGINFAAQRD